MTRFALCFAILTCAACVGSGSADQGGSSSGGGGTGSSSGSANSGASSGQIGESGTGKSVDTCTGGDNMSEVRLVGQPTAGTGDTTLLQIAWDAGTDRGASLPATYFEKVELQPNSLVTKTEPAGEREMIVTIAGAPAAHAGKTEKLTLEFSDRRDFITCSHGGMADAYYLTVTVTFAGDGSTATATFEQTVALGDY